MLEMTPQRGAATALQIGQWQFDNVARDLTDGVRTRRLTPKAAAVLAALAEAEGQVVTRTDLLDRVWPDTDVCEEALTHSVAEIRRAMDDKGAQRILETVHGTGYRLRCPIRPVQGDFHLQAAERAEDFDLDAYLDYSEARRLCEHEGERALGRAVALCGTAVARAPRCASILSEFAILTAMHRLYAEGGDAKLEDALSVADRATGLKPQLACGHRSRGVVLAGLGQKSDACTAFNRAIQCDPQDFQAHYHYARALFAFGDFSRAARMAECAAALRPDDYRPLFLAATSRSALGEPDRARSGAVTGLARLSLHFATGGGGSRAESALGLFLALAGRHEDAHRSIAAHESKRDSMLYYGVAAYSALGEVDTALDRLERIIDRGFRHRAWLESDPTLKPLRRSPRYKRLIAPLLAA